MWCGLLAIATAVMRFARPDIDQAHVVLGYLLVVLGGSVAGGRGLGFTIAFVSFLLIDYFFQYPYDAFAISKPLDLLVLVAYLATAMTATHLLARERAQAAEVRRRADEIVRLSAEAEHANALREADRLKDILLASVGHDLRTPLTTIKALAHDGALRGDENSTIIEEQADRLARLVTDVLDLSRIKGGVFPLTLELNAAEDVIGAVARQFSGVPRGRQLVTTVDMSRPALFGNFDFVNTLRILSNLIENALRYAPEGTPVELGVSRDGEMLRFMVADRGPGVDRGEEGRIFDPFYRPPGSVQDGGMGLGLSIARQLAEAQGGSVHYTARAGGGSLFTLLVSACDPAEDQRNDG
jgi:K+-sensing histidine kinase KdpD